MSTTDVAHHTKRAPSMCCVIADIEQAASVILRELRRIQAKQGCGAYLYIDRELRCFVVSEEHSAAVDWTQTHWAEFVGFYRKKPCPLADLASFQGPRPWLGPTLTGLVDDLRGHIGEMA